MLSIRKRDSITIATLRRDVRGHDNNDRFSFKLAELKVVGDVILDLGEHGLHVDNIGPLLDLRKRVLEAGHRLVICRVGERFMRKLEETRIAGYLVFAKDEEQAYGLLAA